MLTPGVIQSAETIPALRRVPRTYTLPMPPTRPISPVAREAAALLGQRVRLGRRERRWTVAALAERVGVSHVTITKVERGDPTVALGTAFEAAALVGVTLFDDDPTRRRIEAEGISNRLAVLPRPLGHRTPENDF